MDVTPTTSSLAQDTYLLVDDDHVFRGRLARALRDRGLQVSEAENAEQVSSRLSQTPLPQKVILDLKLQQQSGLDILSCIRHSAPEAKVVLLTGYGTIASAVEALRLGAVNYLTKPIDPDSLLAAFEGSTLRPRPLPQTPALEQVEWDHIQRVLQDFDGNVSLASKALGLHRRSLQRKLQKMPTKLR